MADEWAPPDTDISDGHPLQILVEHGSEYTPPPAEWSPPEDDVDAPAAVDESAPTAVPSDANSAGRLTGIGAGSVAQGAADAASGIGDVVKAATKVPGLIPGTEWLQHVDPKSISKFVHEKLTSLGMPTPATQTEKTVQNIGEGVGRVVPSIIAPETIIPSLIGSELGEGAKSVVQAAGGSQSAQTAADITGSLVTSVPSLAAGATRLLARGGPSNGANMRRVIDEYAKNGMSPSVGQATESNARIAVEKGVAKVPGGGAPLARSVEANQEAAHSTVDDIVDNLSGGADVSPTGAGSVVEEQVQKASKQYKVQADKAFDAVDKHLPPDTQVAATNTLKTLEDLTKPIKGASNVSELLASPKLKAIKAAFDKDMEAANSFDPAIGPTARSSLFRYQALKEIRTKISNEIDWGPFASDPDNGALKKLWGAITDDLNAGASTVSPKAAQAVRNANALYKSISAKREVLDKVIGKAGGPEKVYSSLMSGTRDGATTLNTVLGALDQPSRNIMAAAALRRLGTPTASLNNAAGDAFNADTFLTNWNKVSPEARKALFGSLPGGYSQSLTQLTKNIEAIKASGRVMVNHSGSAGAAAHGAAAAIILEKVMSGAFKSAFHLTGVGVAANLMQRALTNPRAVRWLAKKTSMPGVAGTAETVAADSAKPAESSDDSEE